MHTFYISLSKTYFVVENTLHDRTNADEEEKIKHKILGERLRLYLSTNNVLYMTKS